MSARVKKTLKKPEEIAVASASSEQRLFRDSGSDEDEHMPTGSGHALATDDEMRDVGEGPSKGKARRASSVGSNATNRSVALSESSMLDLQAQEAEEYHDDAADDPEVIASIPVYLARSLPAGASLQVFQYPTYSAGRPLPIPDSSKERGIYSSARWRPKANMVEVNLPLDMRREMYNHETGEVMGANLGEETTKGKSKVKKEEGGSSISERRPTKLNKIRLQSTEIPNATRYMVGVIRDGAMHLTRLDGVLQLRPSLHHLDAMDAAENEQKRRMKDGADSGGEEAGPPGSKAASKARALNVSIKEDPNQGGARAKGNPFVDHREKIMASQRDAENEPWVELDWQDETVSSITSEACLPLTLTRKPNRPQGDHELLHAHLTSGSKAQLACNTRMSEFLPL